MSAATISAQAREPWRPYCAPEREREMTTPEREAAARLARLVRQAEAAEHPQAPNFRGILMGLVRRPPQGRPPTTTAAEADSWSERIALELPAARRAQAERGAYRYAIDDITRATYSRAEQYRGWGLITGETFEAYAYLWRDGVCRFSSVGRTEALAHAERYGLPLPLSDLDTPEERDARRAERGE